MSKPMFVLKWMPFVFVFFFIGALIWMVYGTLVSLYMLWSIASLGLFVSDFQKVRAEEPRGRPEGRPPKKVV